MKIIFYKQNKKGLSLIEMMVVVVILGVIVLALVTFFTGGTKSWVAGQSQLKAQREARQAIDRMVREIREGNEIKSNSDSYSVTVYIPPFPLEGIAEYYVFYALSGTTMQRDGNPLIDNVQINGESIFKYYNNDGTEVNPPDSTVSKIHINLKVDVDKDSNPDITLNTDVNLRNFGL